jgi:hypothetical protein
MSTERRRNIRVDVNDDLTGGIAVVEPMRVAQISMTGAQIDRTAPLGVGTLHDVRLTLDGRSVVVKGRAVHSTVRQIHREQVFYRTGIEFVDLGGPAAQTIADFVETLVNRPERTGRAGTGAEVEPSDD